jgi:hypothetical protein
MHIKHAYACDTTRAIKAIARWQTCMHRFEKCRCECRIALFNAKKTVYMHEHQSRILWNKSDGDCMQRSSQNRQKSKHSSTLEQHQKHQLTSRPQIGAAKWQFQERWIGVVVAWGPFSVVRSEGWLLGLTRLRDRMCVCMIDDNESDQSIVKTMNDGTDEWSNCIIDIVRWSYSRVSAWSRLSMWGSIDRCWSDSLRDTRNNVESVTRIRSIDLTKW